jgi:hypothetical protein
MLKSFQQWLGSSGAQASDPHQSNTPKIKHGSDKQSAVAVSIGELIALKSSIRGISLMSTRVKNSSITGAHACNRPCRYSLCEDV